MRERHYAWQGAAGAKPRAQHRPLACAKTRPERRRSSHPLDDAFEQAMMERFKRIWYKSLSSEKRLPVASRAEVASFLLFLNKL